MCKVSIQMVHSFVELDILDKYKVVVNNVHDILDC